jgi:hypothetical protein
MFDPDAHLPRINRGMIYLGACLIAGIRLAREKQVNVRVIPTSTAIEESVDLAHEIYNRVFRKVPECVIEKSKWGLEDMCADTKESLRIFLTQQLRDVEEDIETISSYVSCNPPETSGELLKLRDLQRKYREIAASIKNEIVKLG